MAASSTVWIIYGPAGCGKSHLCSALAQAMSGVYIEGDEYHSAENVAKMRAGIALQDIDRQDWLLTLAKTSIEQTRTKKDIFMSCSALKSQYRDVLRTVNEVDNNIRVNFIYLKLDYQTACQRAAARVNHYMADTMVQGQYQILEEPQLHETDIITADASLAPDALLKWMVALIAQRRLDLQ